MSYWNSSTFKGVYHVILYNMLRKYTQLKCTPFDLKIGCLDHGPFLINKDDARHNGQPVCRLFTLSLTRDWIIIKYQLASIVVCRLVGLTEKLASNGIKTLPSIRTEFWDLVESLLVTGLLGSAYES